MNNILCKIGLHKSQKVKSTKTNILNIMKDILKTKDEPFKCCSEETICEKFGVDNVWIGYEIYDEVCIRPGCGHCKCNVEKKRNQLMKAWYFIERTKTNNKDKDKTIENIYRRCKNGS